MSGAPRVVPLHEVHKSLETIRCCMQEQHTLSGPQKRENPIEKVLKIILNLAIDLGLGATLKLALWLGTLSGSLSPIVQRYVRIALVKHIDW